MNEKQQKEVSTICGDIINDKKSEKDLEIAKLKKQVDEKDLEIAKLMKKINI